MRRCLKKHWLMLEIENRGAACTEADRFLRGEIGYSGLTQAPTPDGAIDWLANPTLGKPNETFAWVFGLVQPQNSDRFQSQNSGRVQSDRL